MYGKLTELQLHVMSDITRTDILMLKQLKTLKTFGLYGLEVDILRQLMCKEVLPDLENFGCSSDPAMFDLFKEPCHIECLRRIQFLTYEDEREPLQVEYPSQLSNNLLSAFSVDPVKQEEIKVELEDDLKIEYWIRTSCIITWPLPVIRRIRIPLSVAPYFIQGLAGVPVKEVVLLNTCHSLLDDFLDDAVEFTYNMLQDCELEQLTLDCQLTEEQKEQLSELDTRVVVLSP